MEQWQLISGTGRVARNRGYAHGWPSFAYTTEPTAEGGHITYFGTYLLPAAPWFHFEDVRRDELEGSPSRTDVGRMLWAGNRWARAHGHKAALPTFEEADYNDGRGTVYGMFLFHNDSPVTSQAIYKSELEGASPVQPWGDCADPGATWSAVNVWAFHHDYPAGFPDYEAWDNGRGMVYGAHLVEGASGLAFNDVAEEEITDALGLPRHLTVHGHL